jgi:hypothetical protein
VKPAVLVSFVTLNAQPGDRDEQPAPGASDEIAAQARESIDMPKESAQEKKSRQQHRPPPPPFRPFTRDSAMQKVRLAKDAWNTRDPAKGELSDDSSRPSDAALRLKRGRLK